MTSIWLLLKLRWDMGTQNDSSQCKNLSVWSSLTLLHFLPATEVPLIKEFIAVWMHICISTNSISIWSPFNTLYAGITLIFRPSLSNLILVKYTFLLSKELDPVSNVVIVPTINTPKHYKGNKEGVLSVKCKIHHEHVTPLWVCCIPSNEEP